MPEEKNNAEMSEAEIHKTADETRDPYSQQTLQRAYQMYEQGSTHFAAMQETGMDRETALWISNRQLAGLGIPADKPVTIVDAELEDELWVAI